MESRVWHAAYESGVPTDIAFENATIPEFLNRSVAEFGDRPAVVFMNRTLSYRQLQEEVDRFATALTQLGVTRDTRVAVQLPNLPQSIIALYATLKLGAQAVMTNPLYVERELEHQWHDAGCTVAVVADFLYTSRIAAIRDKLPIKDYIIASVPEYLRFPLNVIAGYKLRRAKPPTADVVPPGPGYLVGKSR